jgi:diguanylate cyclase (GGDEF)-like protein
LASVAAAVVTERPGQISQDEAVGLIAAALLTGAPAEKAEPALSGLAVLQPRAAALAATIEQPLGEKAGELSREQRSWALGWASRIGYWQEVLRGGDGAALTALTRSVHFEWLPQALREDLKESARFHDRTEVPSLGETSRGAPQARGPPSAASLVREGRAKGLISAAQGEAWLSAAYRDPLTGLPNRLYLDDHLPELVGRKRTLLTFKLDDLKRVNDDFDHETGNKLLQAVAGVARGTLGDSVEAIRRSPTGFAVFVDGDESDALVVGEALRAAVAEQLGSLEKVLPRPAKDLSGTISVGEAAFSAEKAAEPAYQDALERSERARTFAQDVGGGDRVAVDDSGPRLAERRTPAEIAARLRSKQSLTSMAARFETTRRAPLSDLTAALAAKAVDASRLVEQAPPQLREELFAVLYRDRLSGLRNRRWLFDHLGTLFKAGGITRYVALDLDHFGQVNERLGEERADLVLKELGKILEEQVKPSGALALHLSGEEFVILAKDGVDAAALAESVRTAVETQLGLRAKARYGITEPGSDKPLEVTISLGIARVTPTDAPKPTLTLATAMAEAMLQRAKEGGRNRVESDEAPVTAAELLSRLSRLIRVDASVRDVVAKVLGAQPTAATAHPFDNTFKTRAEVVGLLGYDPAAQPGSLLSSPEKYGSWVARVQPAGKEARVVKIALEETVVNEMAMRGVLDSFELFSENLRAPRAVAYRRWFRSPVMVMEDVPNRSPTLDGRNLPIPQKAALAMFALTFGIHDLNPGAFLDVGWKRTTLADFERARTRTSVGSDRRVGVLGEMAWVGQYHLNDYADYKPAFDRWRATFARPAGQKELAAILRRAGVPEARIARDLAMFAENVKRLPQVLAKDIEYANREFRDDARRAGLDERQTLALSAVNRAAHLTPEGGAMRDVMRRLYGDGRARPTFQAEPAELLALASRRDAFSAAAREALARAAERGEVRGLEGGPMPVSRALAAFDALAALLSRK